MKQTIRQPVSWVLCVMLALSCMTGVVQAASIELPDLISDNMLIQCDMPVKLWGYGGNEGDVLKVEIENEKGVAISEGTTTIGARGFNIEIPAVPAGGPYIIRFLNEEGDKLASVYNVLAGDLWYQGGQSNMQMSISGIPDDVEERVNPDPKDDTLRLFYNRAHISSDVPATDIEGEWVIADKKLTEYSAVGYKALETMHNALDIPIGGICTPYGGTTLGNFNNPDNGIYKAKLAPITQFNIKGVMWYQGGTDCGNGRTAEEIETGYKKLVDLLREKWNNPTLAFMVVQLHQSSMKGLVYGSETEYKIKDHSPARLAQSNLYMTDENVGMAVTMDLSLQKYKDKGEDPSHPRIKAPIGERLGNAALYKVYGKDIPQSPVYTGYTVADGKLEITVQDAYDGLKTSDQKAPWGFRIAGADGVYYEATATLSGNKITLSSDKVAEPVSASYGVEKHIWPYTDIKNEEDIANAPELPDFPVNVVNSAGLPLGAFDTTFSVATEAAAASQEQTDEVKTEEPSAPVKVEEIENSGDRTILYVATDGKDSNAGTMDSPFATIEKARDTIREMKKSGTLGKGGAVVYIREGEYLVQKGFELGKEDSGTEEAPVIYRNYPDEKVKFLGGAQLSSDSFKKVTDSRVLNKVVDENARNKLVAVDMFALGYTELPEQTWPGAYSYIYGMDTIHGKKTPEALESELIIDGNAMTVAKYPNEGYMYIEGVIEPGENVRHWHDDKIGTEEYIPPEKRKTTPFTITVNDNRIKYWTEAKDALMWGCFYHSWADQTVPLASVDVSKNALTSKYPSVYTAQKGQHFYIFNLLEEIDIPGEYFVDREAGMLYLYPPESGIGTALYTTLEDCMFEMLDTEYITIKGIDMAYMRNSAVEITNGKGCKVIDCEINYTGKTAVVASGYDNKILDCYIYDVNRGISVSGGDAETLTHGNNYVENNEVVNADRIQKTYSPAINFGGTGNYYLYNKLHEADHLVMQGGGVEQTIAYNEIYNACLHADDMGAIYTGRSLTQRGNRIMHNYIHDLTAKGIGTQGIHAIFLDDFWEAADIFGNVFENIAGVAVVFAGSHNKAYNNVFVNIEGNAVNAARSYNYGAATTETTFREDIANKPYIFGELWLSKYPEMANIIDENDRLDINNNIVIKQNVLYNSEEVKASADVKETAVIEENYVFGTDPGFYDMKNRNYLIKPDSEIYTKIPGFQPILFTRMGQYSERAIARINKAYVLCVDSPYRYINGERIKGEKTGAVVMEEKIYIPLRTAVEAVGGTLEFDESTNEISITTGAKQVSLADGAKNEIILNGAEYKLSYPIINKEYTNYITAEDAANIFEKQLVQHGNIAIISDTEKLFTDVVDDSLLRYIEEQITMY